MEKTLVIIPEKCTGCRTCEVVCSFNKEGEFIPVLARVRVLEKEGLSFPMMCQRCEDAACMAACPVEAISRHEVTGAIIVNDELCIKCEACVGACPYGSIVYQSAKDLIAVCNLCGGEPECAKYCQAGAIVYGEADEVTLSKKEAAAAKYIESFGGEK